MRKSVLVCFWLFLFLIFVFSANSSLQATEAPLCFYKSFEAGASPFSIHGSDVDDDGLIDLIVGNLAIGDNLKIFGNLGEGDFQLIQTYAIKNVPMDIHAADFNGDSMDDLIIATGKDSVALLIHKDERGDLFHDPVYYEAVEGCVSVCASDFDLDGDDDLAISAVLGPEVAILFNNGGVRAGIFGDLDTYSLYQVLARPAQVFAADLNGNGYPDLAVGSSQGQRIALLINKGGEDPDSAGKFHPPQIIHLDGAQPTSLWAGLLNDDSLNDIAVSFYGSNTMCVIFNDAQNPGNFSAPVNFQLGYVPQFILGVDLDNKDGNDLVALNEGYPKEPGNLYVFFNDGHGNFELHDRIFFTEPSEYDPFSIGMFSADFDKDNDLDIAVANLSAGKLSIMLNSEKIRGDVNNSGQVDVVDGVYLYNYLFKQGPQPYSLTRANPNCDERISISDIFFILKYIFLSFSSTPCCLCDPSP